MKLRNLEIEEENYPKFLPISSIDTHQFSLDSASFPPIRDSLLKTNHK